MSVSFERFLLNSHEVKIWNLPESSASDLSGGEILKGNSSEFFSDQNPNDSRTRNAFVVWDGNNWLAWEGPKTFGISPNYVWTVYPRFNLPDHFLPPGARGSTSLGGMPLPPTHLSLSSDQRKEITSVLRCNGDLSQCVDITKEFQPVRGDQSFSDYSPVFPFTPNLKVKLDDENILKLVPTCYPTLLGEDSANGETALSAGASYVFNFSKDEARRLGMKQMIWTTADHYKNSFRQPAQMCVDESGGVHFEK